MEFEGLSAVSLPPPPLASLLPSPPSEDWKHQLLHSYTSVSDLVQNRLITVSEAESLQKIGEKFKVRITPYYAKIMTASLDCPIRQQAVPQLGEDDPALPEWAEKLSQKIYGRATPWQGDAIGDIRNLAAPRLTHRYHDRALLHVSSLCAVYCRFCFRKSHLNDEERTLYEGSLEPAFQYLQEAKEIRELILTGGDPLSLTDSVLERLLIRISQLPHIRTVRFHTRMTVTLPYRFTASLLKLLERDWGFQISLVSHFNHPKELTFEASSALRQLRRTGIILLNQSVLLKGINNSLECLQSLFQSLYEAGIIPYYLHHPDWTPGTFHFRPSIEEGQRLVSALRGRLSGPALPKYILDIPQGFGKVSLLDSRIQKLEEFPYLESLNDSNIGGAVYQLIAPSTRAGAADSHLYLDLFPKM